MIRKLILFIIGIMLLGAMSVAIFLTGSIYNAGEKRTVEPYFFQPNNYSEQRPGQPLTPDQLGDNMRLMLIRRFVTEYLYVFPDVENISARTKKSSALYVMSGSKVFEYWKDNVAPVLSGMANEGMLRMVYIDIEKDISKYGDYDEVKYKLLTWSHPNDMTEVPKIEDKTMLIKTRYELGLRPEYEEDETMLTKQLNQGYDPVVAFKFKVDKVQILD